MSADNAMLDRDRSSFKFSMVKAPQVAKTTSSKEVPEEEIKTSSHDH